MNVNEENNKHLPEIPDHEFLCSNLLMLDTHLPSKHSSPAVCLKRWRNYKCVLNVFSDPRKLNENRSSEKNFEGLVGDSNMLSNFTRLAPR